MTKKDLVRLDSIKERLDNLPDVLDLRVKIEWKKLSKAEHDLLFKGYQELDDLLNEARAFMSTKFPERQDLIQIWNGIDFDTKIESFKITTNDPKSIKSSWLRGMSDFYSFIKTMRAEVVIQIEDHSNIITSNDESNTIIKNSNVFYGNVKNSKSKVSNKKRKENKIKHDSPSDGIEHKESISWQRMAIIISILLALIGLIFSYLMHKDII